MFRQKYDSHMTDGPVHIVGVMNITVRTCASHYVCGRWHFRAWGPFVVASRALVVFVDKKSGSGKLNKEELNAILNTMRPQMYKVWCRATSKNLHGHVFFYREFKQLWVSVVLWLLNIHVVCLSVCTTVHLGEAADDEDWRRIARWAAGHRAAETRLLDEQLQVPGMTAC